MKIAKPTKEQLDFAFNAEDLLAELKSKVPDGAGLAPIDMVSASRMVFEAGVVWAWEYFEHKLSGESKPEVH